MHILVDGDPIVYSRGIAGEERTYEVIYETEDGVESRIFNDGNEKNKWIKDNNIKVIESGPPDVYPKHVSHALAPIKRTILAIRNEVRDRFMLREKDISMTVYLTGADNFRERIATERVYKGNRNRLLRPYYYEECRLYLRERWQAQVIDGYEADDAISIESRSLWDKQVPHIIATVDKDLDQIPGPHYDYNKKVWYHVDKEDAMMFFYEQVLQGDSTDNIPGIYRMGKTKAKDLVKDWAAAYYRMGNSPVSLEEFLWSRCVGEYADSMEQYPDHYKGTDSVLVALENARLVKMQEYQGQLWTPPGVPDEVVE